MIRDHTSLYHIGLPVRKHYEQQCSLVKYEVCSRLPAGAMQKRVVGKSLAWSDRWLMLCTDSLLLSNEKGGEIKDEIHLMDIADIDIWNEDNLIHSVDVGPDASASTSTGPNIGIGGRKDSTKSLSKAGQAQQSIQMAKGLVKNNHKTLAEDSGAKNGKMWSGHLSSLQVCSHMQF